MGRKHRSESASSSTASLSSASTSLTISYALSNLTRYATMPFPQDYEEAVTGALNLLGKHMNIRDPQPSDVIVKYSTRNSDKQRVFAEFDPVHWTSIVHPGAEVRLEERKPPAVPVQRYDMFKSGPIYLVFGQSDGSLTTWTPFQEGDPLRTPPIDRPSSYAEAVERTVNAVNGVKLMLGIEAAKSMKSAMAQILAPGKTLSFYFFPSGGRGDLNEWCKIPASAETNDKQWQEVVPAPGHSDIMGVVAS